MIVGVVALCTVIRQRDNARPSTCGHVVDQHAKPMRNKAHKGGEEARMLTLMAALVGVVGCSGDPADAPTSTTASRDVKASAPAPLPPLPKPGKVETTVKPVDELLAELEQPPVPAGPTTVAGLRDEPSVQPLLDRIEALGGELALDRDRVMSKGVHLQIKTLLATDWKNKRFGGDFGAAKATGLVMIESELAIDVGYGVRLAYSDNGTYKYYVKLEDEQKASPPVYRFRTSDGDESVMGVIEFEKVAASLMEFLDRLRAEP